MRIWDGVTDPFIGYLVDKTNTKFGKNRPFMVIGNVILAVASFILLHVTHLFPQGARFYFLCADLHDLYHWLYVPMRSYEIRPVLSDQ